MSLLSRTTAFFNKANKQNEEKKSSSFLELFLDIAWIVMLGGIVHNLVEIIKGAGGLNQENLFAFFYSLLLIFLMNFVWKVITFYNSRYEDDSVKHRLFVLCIMIGFVVSSCSIYIEVFFHNANNVYPVVFINEIGLSIVFVCIIWQFFLLWVREKQNPYEKKLLFRSFMGPLITLVVLLPSVFVDVNSYETLLGTPLLYVQIVLYVSWFAAIFNWFLWDWFSRSRKISVNIKQFSNEHIQDRYNVFLIVFIGEATIQIVSTSEANLAFNSVTTGEIMVFLTKVVACFSIMFFSWWIFNDTISKPDISKDPMMTNLFSLAGLIVIFSFVFTSSGFSLLLGEIENDPEFLYGKLMLAIGIILWNCGYFLMYISIKKYNKEKNLIINPAFFGVFGCYFLASFTFLPMALLNDQVSNFGFIMLIFSGGLLLVVIEVALRSKEDKQRTRAIISNLEKQSHQALVKKIKPFLDVEVHKKHDFRLNHFYGLLGNDKTPKASQKNNSVRRTQTKK